MKLWQYQQLAEPVSLEPEATAVLKWFSQSPDPVRLSRFRAAVFASSLAFVVVVAAPIVPPVDAWHVQSSEPVRAAVSHAYVVPTTRPVLPPAPPPVPPVESWVQPIAEPVRIARPPVYTSPAFVEIVSVPVPDMDSWFQPISTPTRRIVGAGYLMSPPEIYLKPIPLVDTWYQELCRPVLPRFHPYYYPTIDARAELAVISIAGLDLKYPQIEWQVKNGQIEWLAEEGQIEWES